MSKVPSTSAVATSSSAAATSSSAAATTSSGQYTYSNGTYFPTPFHLQQPSQPYIGAAPPPVQFPAPSYYPAPPPVQLPAPSVYPAPAVPGVYALPQFQQAQQLFQRDAQTITPEAIENVKAALASSEIIIKLRLRRKLYRKAAGQSWEDPYPGGGPE
ncbi:hypothetical protein HAX54_022009 [Datura stramonium]|uniref:Uncharacterized protein n=1 Tax=Datura stramonium TaxID=4076 RepID=A0ABS8UTJ1_DATST|nr:hypothetical protein [Datura stramonium]